MAKHIALRAGAQSGAVRKPRGDIASICPANRLGISLQTDR